MIGSQVILLIVSCLGPLIGMDERYELNWISNYREARSRSKELNIPILINISGSNCIYCKKMNSTTLRNSEVVGVLQGNFIALNLDAIRDRDIVKALGVRLLPTFIIADPQGNVISNVEGLSSAEEFKTFLSNGLDKIYSNFDSSALLAEAIINSGEGNLEKAKKILERIIKREPLSVSGKKAEALLGEFEKNRSFLANSLLNSDNKIKDLKAPGSLVSRSLKNKGQSVVLTNDLLEKMLEERKSGRLIMAHDLAQQIKLIAPGTTAENDAQRVIDDSMADPQAVKQLVEAQSDKLANLLFQSAEIAIKQGQPQQAVYYLERISQIFPGSKYANSAQTRLAQIQGPPSAIRNIQTTP